MIRRTLCALALVALLPAAALTATASAQESIITPEAHKLADQRAAITYARELIAAGTSTARSRTSRNSSRRIPMRT